jgi:hypothetical protein
MCVSSHTFISGNRTEKLQKILRPRMHPPSSRGRFAALLGSAVPSFLRLFAAIPASSGPAVLTIVHH